MVTVFPAMAGWPVQTIKRRIAAATNLVMCYAYNWHI